jgi:hypothetical protein
MGWAPIAMRARLMAVVLAALAIVLEAAWIAERAPNASHWDHTVAIAFGATLVACVSILLLARRVEAISIAPRVQRVQEHLFWTRNNILLLIQASLVAALYSVVATGNAQASGAPSPARSLCVLGACIVAAWLVVVHRSDYLLLKNCAILSAVDERFAARCNDPPCRCTWLRLTPLWTFVGIAFACGWLALLVHIESSRASSSPPAESAVTRADR